jgi:hypothetical protein
MVIESPAELPVLAQSGASDLFLHDASNGNTYLYVEVDGGQRMAILDVTDPAAIRAVANVPVAASAAFELEEDINSVDTLVRYRGNRGLGVLDFSTFDRPSINESPEFAAAGSAQPIGNSGALLASAAAPLNSGLAGSSLRREAPNYDVMDTSHAGTPVLLASISGVKQQLTKLDTGTVFLLADNGVTVVRDLGAEKARARHINVEMQ